MNPLTPNALLIWLALPLAYAALVPSIRAMTQPGVPEDRAEKRALALMLLPFLIGGALLIGARFVPIALPEFVALDLAGPYPSDLGHGHAERVEDGPWTPSPVSLILAGYFGVALFKFGQLAWGRWRLYRIASSARPSGLEEDVDLTADLSVPVISGRGRILMPSKLAETLDRASLDLIVSHERRHDARGDQRYFVGLAALDAIFWFHPGLRWQTARCRLAAELDCDETVCAEHPELRKTYADLIVKTLHNAAGHALPCAPAVFSPRTKGEFGMRLTKIMRPRTGARKSWGLPLAALSALPLIVGQLALAEQASVQLVVAPVEEGRVTSRFGIRHDPFNPKGAQRSNHLGVDVAGPSGTPIRAAGAGVVTFAAYDGAYGYRIDIQHADNIVTRYAQLLRVDVEVGDRVIPGQTIAPMGNSGRSTATHLHFEVVVDGTRVDPESLVPAVERSLPRKRD